MSAYHILSCNESQPHTLKWVMLLRFVGVYNVAFTEMYHFKS